MIRNSRLFRRKVVKKGPSQAIIFSFGNKEKQLHNFSMTLLNQKFHRE